MPMNHAVILHGLLICEKCKAPLNGTTEEELIVEDGNPDDGDEEGCATICVYCGAVYRTEVSPAELKRGVPENWRRWPDDELPDELRELQLKYARGQIPLAPGASRRGNPS